IKYRDVTVTSRDLKPLPLAEVLKVLAAADLDDKPEAAIDVAAKLSNRENFDRNLPTFEFISDGRRTRQSGNSWVRIDDGEWDVNSSHRGRPQIDVWSSGYSEFPSMTLSRLVVNAPPAAEVERRRAAGEELEIDPTTQFVRRRAWDTSPYREQRQSAPKTYDPSLVFPQLLPHHPSPNATT